MKNTLLNLSMALALLAPVQSAYADIVFAFTNSTRTMIIPTPVGTVADANAVGGATSYYGVWYDDNPLKQLNGTWSLDIEFDSVTGDVLEWASSSGFTGDTVSIGAGGAGLALDFDTDPSILRAGALEMTFSVAARGGYTVDGVTYSVGIPGSTSQSDWGTATVNTGGTLTADSVANTPGGENPTYVGITGSLTPTNDDSEHQDWYITWSSGTTVVWDGGVNDVDTHVFGFSGASLSAVPEPSNAILLGITLGCVLFRRRRNREFLI